MSIKIGIRWEISDKIWHKRYGLFLFPIFMWTQKEKKRSEKLIHYTQTDIRMYIYKDEDEWTIPTHNQWIEKNCWMIFRFFIPSYFFSFCRCYNIATILFFVVAVAGASNDIMVQEVIVKILKPFIPFFISISQSFILESFSSLFFCCSLHSPCISLLNF